MSTNGLSGKIWALHPKPKCRELLSSWLTRLALTYHQTTQSFCYQHWPDLQIWTRDIDVFAPSSLISSLALRTGTQLSVVRNTTLGALSGFYFESFQPKGTTALLMPVGVRHRIRLSYGMQYCPMCLREQAVFELPWRIACNTFCPKHGCVLWDCCPQCRRPLAYHRTQPGKPDMGLCPYCGADYRNAPLIEPAAPSECLSLMREWFDSSRCNSISLASDFCLEPLSFFVVLRQLAKLSIGHQHDRFWQAIPKMGYLGPGFDAAHHTLVEKLRVHERFAIFSCCSWLLLEWPSRFLEWAKTAGFHSSDLLKDREALPFWFASCVHDGLYSGKYIANTTEIKSAQRYQHRVNSTKSAIVEIYRLLHASYKNPAVKKLFHHYREELRDLKPSEWLAVYRVAKERYRMCRSETECREALQLLVCLVIGFFAQMPPERCCRLDKASLIFDFTQARWQVRDPVIQGIMDGVFTGMSHPWRYELLPLFGDILGEEVNLNTPLIVTRQGNYMRMARLRHRLLHLYRLAGIRRPLIRLG